MAPKPLDFSGKCVIVTGGTKGIGRVMATTFMEYGADVVVCARNPPAEPVTAAGKTATFVAVRLCAMPSSARPWRKAAVDQFGRIDVLINNAGGAPAGRFRPRVRLDSTSAS
jgi:NAD(P)-dependent dehydrogenase (short-subunit alcohol dehydrogenase family)